MSARAIRRIVIAVCVVGIAGMLAGSITSHIGVAITAGVAAAVGVLCLILVTAVAGPAAFGGAPPIDQAAADDIERRVEALVAGGADEAEVRSLVRAVHRMSRQRVTSQ